MSRVGADRSGAAESASPRGGSHMVLVGPTASGKSAVAMELARRRRAEGRMVELVSADSMQVYRGMDIGTAKPTTAEQMEVPHHLIDLIDPGEEYSVAEFVAGANEALHDIAARGATAIVVGGTGLYVQALVDGFSLPGRYPEVRKTLEADPHTAALHDRLRLVDPRAASRIEPTNRRRIVRALEVTLGSGRRFSDHGPGMEQYPVTDFVLVGLSLDRDLLSQRVESRFSQQLDDGFLAEVAALESSGTGISRTAAQALGYRELREHLRGNSTLSGAIDDAVTRTRQFAVRQLRWFRRDPRIRWFEHRGDPMDLVDPIGRYWDEQDN